MKTHSTYHVDCICGRAIVSETRETTSPHCKRLLVFEWGRDAVVIEPPKEAPRQQTLPGAKLEPYE